MKLKALIEQVANRAGKLLDYTFKKDVENAALDTYALFVRRDYTARGRIMNNCIQTLNCIELIEVDKYECCGPNDGCKVLRTKLVVPETIQTKSPTPYIYVGTIDMGNPFTHVSPSALSLRGQERFKSLQDKFNIEYTLKNGYIYILNLPTLEFISITDSFARPHELDNCCKDCSGSCYDKTGDFLLPSHMTRDIRIELYKEYGIQQVEKDNEYQIEINK